MRAVERLAHAVHNRYGDKVKISVVNPASLSSLWYHFRYRMSLSLPAWVLDRKKICDGIPELADLERAIDEKLAAYIKSAQLENTSSPVSR